MPRRRPRKVVCADDSTASDVAVVMALLYGRVDGVERVVGFLVLATLRQRQPPDRVREA